MKDRILTNWTFIRVLYLLMGLFVIGQSAMSRQWIGILFGGYIASMGLFARWFNALEPISANGITAVIALFVPNVEEVMQKAITAGAIEINPVKDHEYDYRQGMFKDPFGHYWQIQKKI